MFKVVTVDAMQQLKESQAVLGMNQKNGRSESDPGTGPREEFRDPFLLVNEAAAP